MLKYSFIFYRDIQNENVTTNVPVNLKKRRIPTDRAVYELLEEDPTQTREELAAKLDRTVRTIQRASDKLSSDEKIRRIGSNKTGYWEVIKDYERISGFIRCKEKEIIGLSEHASEYERVEACHIRYGGSTQ